MSNRPIIEYLYDIFHKNQTLWISHSRDYEKVLDKWIILLVFVHLENVLTLWYERVKLTALELSTVVVNKEGNVIERPQYRVYSHKELLSLPDLFIEMMSIHGGIFMMGSSLGEGGHIDERPQHKVCVSPFWMSKYPITQSQWKFVAELDAINRYLDPNPSRFKGDNHPVERVFWVDAVEYCARLSRFSGKDFRLPSEAEWEYACRGGTRSAFHFGSTLTPGLANYDVEQFSCLANYDTTYIYELQQSNNVETSEVGQYPANGFGLHDMHGNVWEWCQDNWHSDYEGAPNDGSVWYGGSEIHVLRGGSIFSNQDCCYSAFRNRQLISDNLRGFRIVCSFPMPFS